MKYRKLYESYHDKISLQKRIITSKNFTYRHIIVFLGKYLRKGNLVLDIGSGAGTIDFYLGSKGYQVYGVDISKKATDLATLNAKSLGLQKKVKFQRMFFPKKTPLMRFDFIICSEVIEHLENDELAFRRFYKLLKKDGVVFITTPSSSSLLEKLGLLNKYNSDVGHLRTYSENRLKSLAKNSGFKILELYKNEGLFRKLLFIVRPGKYIIKVANRFAIISDLLTLVDKVVLRALGETHYFLVARKKK